MPGVTTFGGHQCETAPPVAFDRYQGQLDTKAPASQAEWLLEKALMTSCARRGWLPRRFPLSSQLQNNSRHRYMDAKVSSIKSLAFMDSLELRGKYVCQ